MVEAFADQAGEVSVVDSVDHPPSFFAGVDQAGESKFGQVLTDCCAGGVAGFGEGGDVGFALSQQPQDVKPGGIGQHAEGSGRSVETGLIGRDRMYQTCLGPDVCHGGHGSIGHRRAHFPVAAASTVGAALTGQARDAKTAASVASTVNATAAVN